MTLEEQNILIEKNIPLVHYCIKRYFNKYMFDEDVASCGKLALVKAGRTFDSDKNIKFSTYAIQCIKNEINMYFRHENKYSNIMSLNMTYENNNDDDEIEFIDLIADTKSCFSQIENTDLILSFKNILTDKAYTYFVLYYIQGLTQIEIAEKFNISRSSVCKSLYESREKIKRRFSKELL